jgi:predicted small integral membrane protein
VSWHRLVAFTTLVLAIFAAISALLAGLSAGEVLVDRTEEIVELTEARGDQIRVEVLRAKHELLAVAGVAAPQEEVVEIEEIEAAARESEEEGNAARDKAFAAEHTHLVFAVAAAIFAVSIAVTGMAVIVNQQWLWVAGGVGGLVGLAILGIGLAEYL